MRVVLFMRCAIIPAVPIGVHTLACHYPGRSGRNLPTGNAASVMNVATNSALMLAIALKAVYHRGDPSSTNDTAPLHAYSRLVVLNLLTSCGNPAAAISFLNSSSREFIHLTLVQTEHD